MLPGRGLTLGLLLLAAVCAQFAAGQGAGPAAGRGAGQAGPQAASNPGNRNSRDLDATQFGERVTLGPNWLFKAGDDPAYASPTFDDSAWQTISTTKPLTEYGIRDIHYAWYRAHIRLRPDAHNLAIGLERTNGSYEVYANGVRVGSNGNMAGLVRFYQRALAAYAVPDNLLTPQGDLVLALRFSLDVSGNRGRGTSVPIHTSNPDLPSAVYILSGGAVPREVSYANAHNTYDDFLLGGLALLAGLVALALYLALRSQREYLAATIYLLASAGIYSGWLRADFAAYTLPVYWLEVLFRGTANFAIIEFVRLILGRPRSRWLLTFQVAAFVAPCGQLLAVTGIGGTVYAGFFTFYLPILLVDILLLVMLIRGWRRGNREARVLLPAVVVLSFAEYWTFLNNLAFYIRIFATPHPLPILPIGSYRFTLADIGDFVFYLTMLLFLVLRTVAIARERAHTAAELEAAREVQQQLVPASLPSQPGFQLRAVYRPAAEVGGDFYQVIDQDDGSFLVAIGDVSGKGLKAAMTSALALGALRALAAEKFAPAQLLERLNREVLRAKSGGFITCLCARVAADGTVTLANAGHLSPYRNGKEVVLEPSLPLGVAPDTRYHDAAIRLAPGEVLTLLSDGVIEARNAKRELFGFERTAAISCDSAESIAGAAQNFGQDDDITVLTLERMVSA
jgi:phosphoserine phosphatase RsbU/P